LTVDPTHAAFNSLAVGQSQTIEVSYQVKDAQGATVNQTATITITGANDAAIINGTSNVSINTADGNVTIGVDGTSNVAVITTDTVSVTGNVEATVAVIANVSYVTNGLALNQRTVTANYTVPTDYNALSAGPITVANAVVVNIGTSSWVIV
jgi:hypothetical protein